MDFPSAPNKYSRADQDQVRRITSENFDRVFERLRSLELAPSGPGIPQPPIDCGDFVWGSALRNGTIQTFAPGIRTTQFNAGANEVDGYRFYAGLKNAGDLTTWVVDGDKRPIRDFGTADHGTWWGGYCKPDYLINGVTHWENNLADEYHGHVGIEGPAGTNFWLRNFSCDNVGDGVVLDPSIPPGGGDGWLVDGCAFSNCHDDVIENDAKHEGTVCDSFCSGMMLFGARPAATDTDAVNTDRSGQLFTVRNCINWSRGWIHPDVAPFGGVDGDMAIFGWLKVQVNVGGNGGYAKGMSFALHDNIWRWDGHLSSPQPAPGGPMQSTQAAKVAEQSNNILLMPNQSSGLPPGWPTSLLPSFTFVYATEAEAMWNDVAQDWVNAHPEVTLEDPGYFE